MTDRQIDRRLASGVWTAERRGMLRVTVLGVVGQPGPDDDRGRESPGSPMDAELLDVEAAVRAAAGCARRREFVVSHTSAARLHGLPAPIGGWGPATLTATGGTARRAGLSVAQVEHQLRRQRGWPGIVQARHLLDLADGRRESPLESWSALAFHSWGLVRPEWQIDIKNSHGVLCGRVAAWWPEGLAGEADGRAKYALAAAQQEGAELTGLLDALGRERGRETEIRRTKAEMVRWGPVDVLSRARTEDLCRHPRTLAHPDPRRIAGGWGWGLET